MSRPRKCRRIEGRPTTLCFKPRGIPMRSLTEVYISLDGFEALRLADHQGLTISEGAVRMGISRHTFGRILAETRQTVARALVESLALYIDDADTTNQPQPDRTTDRIKELSMTKIAITSEGPNLTDMVDPRFGRAGGFVVVDLETMATTYVDNGSSQAMAHGAGIQAAENIANAGAGVILTGYVGPKAFEALKAAGIKIGQNLDNMTVAQAVDLYKSGKVEFADTPNK